MTSPVLPTSDRRRPGRSGFTLIEVLLVLAIIAVVAAITLPSFVKSIRGNRLRSAGRTVIMAGRYARSMATLKQVPMRVMFDFGAHAVRVEAEPVEPTRRMERDALEAEGEEAVAPVRRAETSSPAARETVQDADRLARTLERVQIKRVALTDPKEVFTEGVCPVVYQINGRCTPYEVTIEDDQGGSLTIHVDALATADIAP